MASKKILFKNYLKKNDAYFTHAYEAPNVESFIFRFYGRILTHDFNINGKNKEKVFDFGCGRGGNLSLFHKKGFKVFGADIAKKDISIAKKTMPSRKNYFKVIDPKPKKELIFFKNTKFDIVICIQTLIFLSDSDMKIAIENIYNNMNKGAILYVSMDAYSHYYRKNAKYIKDGLWNVKFDNGRVKYDIFVNYTRDKNHMKRRFKLFKPLYIDSYDMQFRHEGSEKRYTFCGVKE